MLGLMCLAQGHNAVTPVRLEPAALRSRVKHSTTEPLRSHSIISTLFAYGNIVRYDTALVDLTSYFCVLCTHVKVYYPPP